MNGGVCIISNHYYPKIGGAEKQVELVSGWIVQQGVPVMVVTRHFGDLPHYEVRDGVAIFRVRSLQGKSLGALSFLLFGVLLILRQRHRFSIVHSHQIFSATTLGWLATRLLRIPLVVHLHLGGEKGDIARLLRHKTVGRIRLELLKRDAAAFVVVSQQIVHELRAEDVPSSKIHLMRVTTDPQAYRPVDEAQREQIRRELGLPASVPLVIFAGRLVEIKGVKVLLKAWAQIPDPVHLVVVGDGPEAKALYQQAEQYGERVIFTGPQHNVIPYLQASNLWVLPSFGEGLPRSLLEAMACGLPVVTTPVGAISDVVTHGTNGLLVPPGDAEALTQAIRYLLDHPAQAAEMSKLGRQTVLEGYSIEQEGAELLRLYETVSQKAEWSIADQPSNSPT